MPFEPKAPVRASRILAGLFFAAIALSACTPTTTEKPLTGPNNPSDPATVKAQVEELKQALADVHAFKTETQHTIGTQKWVDKGTRNMHCTTPDGQEGVNYSIMSQTMERLRLGNGHCLHRRRPNCDLQRALSRKLRGLSHRQVEPRPDAHRMLLVQQALAAMWSQFLPALPAAINWGNKLRRRVPMPHWQAAFEPY
ncbi:hypothetical protein [Paenarthrobacter sp. CAP02]|uniref:hypothetical protein n=1 Tax=Paenarthrobacter sp. CAP02 TaxID=3158144 RepID=UPI0032D9B6A1